MIVRPRRRSCRSRDERGAVALVTALTTSFVLVVVAAVTVDLGVQRVARSDMQALADMVALDLARELDGRTVGQLAPLMPGLAEQSRLRNAGTLGDDPTLEVDLGQVSSAGRFEVLSFGTPTAVRVLAETTVDFAFGVAEDGGAGRSALATVKAGACFRLGSLTATIDTADSSVLSAFSSIVGDALGVRIDAVSYKGLADVFVRIADLAAEMGVGSVDELLALRSVGVGRFFAATARVLSRSGTTTAQATAAAVVTSLSTRVASTLTFDVGDILSVGGPAAVSAQTGVLDLITASAFAIDGDHLLDTGVIWNEPHVSTGDVRLKIVEAPRQACGLVGPDTRATTAQVQLDADLGFNLPNKVGDLLVTNATDPTTKSASLAVRARLGSASGYLSRLTCGAATSAATAESIAVQVTTTFTEASVSLPFRLRGTITTPAVVKAILPADLAALVTALASVELTLDLGATTAGSLVTPGLGPRETTYAVPPHTYGEGEPVPGSSPVSVPRATTSVAVASSTARLKIRAAGLTVIDAAVDVGRLDLTSVLASVTSSVIGTSVNAVVDNVNAVLAPVSTLLGLRTGGADLFGIPRPMCAVPMLTG
ncbi:hypothetical protein ABFT23_15500 [Nocardioides sp. C4-1]|uniref:hypothetical protein n=1 Tax=Nocardioides sp. C4-1 TaxID=3151851 RepID=UPI00326630F4